MFLARARLLRKIDADRVHRAIAGAEHLTSERIHVTLAPFFWGDVRRAAERAFTRLGRRGVLFFLVPARHKFAVLGDEEIHAKVGQEFWHDVTAAVAERFRAGDFTGGLVHGIETVGRELAPVLPYDAAQAEESGGEPPDDIDVE
ncbi:MAG TPA: TPM domain-containing protein [Thermoanaerobaculia bacterium]|nr:TPM domain-containing protein [Thermoanaerobaculia bacterium]